MLNQLIHMLKEQWFREYTRFLMGIGAGLMILALLLGISDNPPGIILGFTALMFLCLSMTHHWREARAYGTLLSVSLIGFPVLVLIHNIFDTLVDKLPAIPIFTQFLQGISVLSFLLAVFVAPVTGVVGMLGGLTWLVRNRNQT